MTVDRLSLIVGISGRLGEVLREVRLELEWYSDKSMEFLLRSRIC